MKKKNKKKIINLELTEIEFNTVMLAVFCYKDIFSRHKMPLVESLLQRLTAILQTYRNDEDEKE